MTTERIDEDGSCSLVGANRLFMVTPEFSVSYFLVGINEGGSFRKLIRKFFYELKGLSCKNYKFRTELDEMRT